MVDVLRSLKSMAGNTHETFDREHSTERSSDRSFGLVFTAFFALVGLIPLLHRHPIRRWALWTSGAFLVVALLVPRILAPLNAVWARFGLLLSKITNPIVTGLMYYLIFTPAGILVRLLGKDLLRLKYDREAATYWIARNPPGPPPETMRNAF